MQLNARQLQIMRQLSSEAQAAQAGADKAAAALKAFGDTVIAQFDLPAEATITIQEDGTITIAQGAVAAPSDLPPHPMIEGVKAILGLPDSTPERGPLSLVEDPPVIDAEVVNAEV